ncbi:hypothetical protein PoB_005462600 [Plakobranchus ocellatus]|uniref:Uncharacterized protein n=1 Tax=Plakobranchus ocellatus TaxID=259542 RepID=A0AAV4BY88_9GAST|nr:hypothetical protein PoB_005462600 [Plakobranchus ocellatus]
MEKEDKDEDEGGKGEWNGRRWRDERCVKEKIENLKGNYEIRMRQTITKAKMKPVHNKVIWLSGPFRPFVRPGRRRRAQNRDRWVPADLRADSLATVPPSPPRLRGEGGGGVEDRGGRRG